MVALILKLCHHKKWFDKVDDRKFHNGNIPRLGGIGFGFAFFVMVVVISLEFHNTKSIFHNLNYLIALFLILVFGIIDDFRPLKTIVKLITQIVSALIVIIPGFHFKRIAYFDNGILPEPVMIVITLIWIVGITNAVNFIDGIDGLAGGISGLIAVSLGLIFFYYGNDFVVLLYCVSLVGVILGFLAFNIPVPRAKIFMGDCGSQFLGFLLAVLPLLKTQNNPACLPVIYAAALLLIPIFDTIAAVWRRIRDGVSIDTPDRAHVHHKLLNIGLSVRAVDVVLCGLQIILCVLVFISISLKGLPSLYVLGAAYFIGITFFSAVHFKNRSVVKVQKLQEGVPSNTDN